MATEHIPVLFRAPTADAAREAAKAWARAEGIRVRTIARVDRREDMEPWWTSLAPGVMPEMLIPWQVTLAVDPATVRPGITL